MNNRSPPYGEHHRQFLGLGATGRSRDPENLYNSLIVAKMGPEPPEGDLAALFPPPAPLTECPSEAAKLWSDATRVGRELMGMEGK